MRLKAGSKAVRWYSGAGEFATSCPFHKHESLVKSRTNFQIPHIFYLRTMIDPLTITASIGFGLAVISFLSNSVSTLTRQGTEFERCKQLLTGYSYQLKDREKNLLAWRFHWYGDYGYSEDTYYYCWGNDYEEFKERFKEIRKLMSDLAGHMALQPESGEFPGLLKGEGRDWTDILSCIKKQGWQQPEARNFVGKLAFAISNNAKLKKKLALLKILTEGLCNSSCISFRLRRGHEIDKNPTPVEIQRLDRTRALLQGLAKFANELYAFHAQNYTKGELDLELRLPDSDGDASQIYLPASISIHLTGRHNVFEYSTTLNSVPKSIANLSTSERIYLSFLIVGRRIFDYQKKGNLRFQKRQSPKGSVPDKFSLLVAHEKLLRRRCLLFHSVL
jgi:hypothetical protein